MTAKEKVFAQEIGADVPEHVWDEFGLGKVESLPVEAKEKVCAATPDGNCLATKDDTLDCCAPGCLVESKPAPSTPAAEFRELYAEEAPGLWVRKTKPQPEQTFRSDEDLLRDILFYSRSSPNNHPKFNMALREACIKLQGFDPDVNAAKGLK